MKLDDFFIMPKIPDDVLARADEKQLRALICFCSSRKAVEGIDFWINEGIFSQDDVPNLKKQTPARAQTTNQPVIHQHSTEIITNSRLYNPEFKLLVTQAEKMWGALSRAHLNSLYGAMKDMGMPVEVVIMMLSHMKESGMNMRAFDRETMRWHEAGYTTIEAAEEYMKKQRGAREYTTKICTLISLDEGKLSAAERAIIAGWHENGIDDETISSAHERSVPYTKEKSPIAYMNSVIQRDRQNPKASKAQQKPQKKPLQDSDYDDMKENSRINLEYLKGLRDEDI